MVLLQMIQNYLIAAAVMLVTTALSLVIPVYLIPWRIKKFKRPLSVNYHFTRKCNKACGFCFHTEKSSHMVSIEKAQQGLTLLKVAGMKKMNFAGGEPTLYKDFLGKVAQYCKETLELESVSLITNGSFIDPSFFRKYGTYFDIIAVSLDSFDEEVNRKIGRGDGANARRLKRIAEQCKEHGIKFKINTVVNRYNFEENMATQIQELQPFRWKVFQVLMVEGENDSEGQDVDQDNKKRNVRKFLISDDEYKYFCDRHKHIRGFVAEPNNLMKSSYIILDEYLQFLDKGTRKETTSESILDVGVEKAFSQVTWDKDAFQERQGEYDWKKGSVKQQMEEQAGKKEGAKSLSSKDLYTDW